MMKVCRQLPFPFRGPVKLQYSSGKNVVPA
uniref:Uncharacterized protein n=1 Tax=Arundo donax TaxID=35708 RepID=A0A0A9BFW6_ARUDO